MVAENESRKIALNSRELETTGIELTEKNLNLEGISRCWLRKDDHEKESNSFNYWWVYPLLPLHGQLTC